MKRMLIDAAHAEETRVVILDGNKIDDFETETQGKQQLKGNIYIGHVSRVEPSLQAAFITYGGNRNGFLAFGEVHPQFFALKKDEKEELLHEMAEQAARRRGQDHAEDDDTPESVAQAEAGATDIADITPRGEVAEPAHPAPQDEETLTDEQAAAKAAAMADAVEAGQEAAPKGKERAGRGRRGPKRMESRGRPQRAEAKAGAEPRERSNQAPIHRRYRIQDVLKEGQKILVQVVKEERGSKGAALTTYFSLPGRYTVLMPNTPYAGGISRKITDPEERRQLRDAYRELKVPDTMGLIIRTAGTGQEISHIKRDYANLTNLWQHIIAEFEANEDIQCIHEDGSVIIRALRDMMGEDVEEVVIAGPRAYKMAKDYAKNLMPDTAKFIKQHKEDTQLFTEYRVEAKLSQLHHSRVTLPSGGYLVINPTEALVAVDINSGRATQERNIEETALKTNLEACDELARQIRLRDLAGLIVVDFIDMEDHRNVRKVESAMRKALKRDRARIQTGNISDFGLMEISRQRLRPSFSESHFIPCAHCQGTGWVHSPATGALMVLRRLEEDDIRDADRVIVTSGTELILWILNHKRDLIRTLEERYKFQLQFRADDRVIAPDHKLELVRIKADGTETSQMIDVTLREQPELPPEKRNYKEMRRQTRERERDDRETEKRLASKSRPERSEKPAREEAEERSERAERPERNAKPGRGERNQGRRPERAGEDSSSRRPRRLGEEAVTEGADEAPAAPAQKDTRKPRPNKPVVAAEASTPKPKREAKPAADEPLAVQKVSVEREETPTAAPAAPRKKVEIKKQADTDAADAPIAVQKVSTEGAASEEKIPARGKKGQSGSIISRLIGR